MGDFTLDTSGAVEAANPTNNGIVRYEWRHLSPFTQGYVEALLRDLAARKCWPANVRAFTNRDDGVHIASLFAFHKIAPEALALILRDCEAVTEGFLGVRNSAPAGRDFWLARNHPEGLPRWKPLTVSLGEDGKVHLAVAQ